MEPLSSANGASLGAFVSRVLALLGILVFCLVLWRLRDALSVAFGSILLATGLIGLTDWTQRKAGWPRWTALTVVLGSIVAVVGLVGWVFEASVAAQYGELGRKVPAGVHVVLAALRETPIGRDAVAQLRGGAISSAAGSGPPLIAGAIRAATQVLTYILVMVAGGVFLALEPERYRRGLLRLIPPTHRDRAALFLGRLADALRRWLVSRLVVMAAVGVLASLGLWALGIDAPFALGLTGALLTFIPFVGALISAVPAVLTAFVQDPILALWVALLFWAVHFVEGTFITPYVQDEAVDVPPVLSIFSTLVFTVLLGPLGVLLAGPLTVVALVSVEGLYVEDVLGEEAPAPHRAKALRLWATVIDRVGDRRRSNLGLKAVARETEDARRLAAKRPSPS